MSLWSTGRQLLLEHLADFGGVGGAAGGLHDLADEKADHEMAMRIKKSVRRIFITAS